MAEGSSTLATNGKEDLAERGRRKEVGLTPFLEAVWKGEKDTVENFLKKGYNIHEKLHNGDGALILASQGGNIDVVKMLSNRRLYVNEIGQDNYTPLHWASQQGKVEIADYLLSRGAKIEAQNRWGRTPFLEAASKGQKGNVELLLRRGCNLHAKNENGDGALSLACQGGHVEVVKMLSDHGLDVNDIGQSSSTSLHWASGQSKVEIVEYLLSRGANIEAQTRWGLTPFLEAALNGQKGTLELLLKRRCNLHAKSENDNGALALACQGGHIEIVKMLSDCGLEVNEINKDSYTPLHWASQQGKVQIVDYLLSRGAKIEAQTRWGLTPFLVAAFKGKKRTVELLLERGCNLYAKCKDGDGALAIACTQGHIEVVKVLYACGLELDETNQAGDTPLHCASRQGKVDIAEYLLSKGAKTEAKNKNGEIPLELALSSGHGNFVEVFSRKTTRKNEEHNENAPFRNEKIQREVSSGSEELARGSKTEKSSEELDISGEKPPTGVDDCEQQLKTTMEQKELLEVKCGALENTVEPKKIQELRQSLGDAGDEMVSMDHEKERMQIASRTIHERSENRNQELQIQIESERAEKDNLALLRENESAVQNIEIQLERERAEKEGVSSLLKECADLKRRLRQARRLAEEAERNLEKAKTYEEISDADVKLSDIKLGSGSYGDVRVGYWRGSRVAVKTFFDLLRVDEYIHQFQQEVAISSRLHHPNIVSLCAVVTENDIPLRIITELLEGSLSDVIKAAKGKLSLREQVDLAVGFVAGISYLHHLGPDGVLHGDIRSTNVVVTSVMEAKVCDLGAARFAHASSLSVGALSPNYLAPERHPERGQHNTKMAEVYSLGVTLIELMTGLGPAATKRLSEAHRVRRPEVRELCLGMIDENPKERPSALDCLAILEREQKSTEYIACPPKRMVKGKLHGEAAVFLVEKPWK